MAWRPPPPPARAHPHPLTPSSLAGDSLPRYLPVTPPVYSPGFPLIFRSESDTNCCPLSSLFLFFFGAIWEPALPPLSREKKYLRGALRTSPGASPPACRPAASTSSRTERARTMSASLAVLSVLAVIVALVATQAFSLFHITPPRHVTVSVRLGKVLETVTGPGLSWKTPLTSSWDMLVEEQVDSVQMVECGTKDGITLVFPRIDVHNILPRSKAREMFLRFGHDYDQLTIFKNVKFFTGQICATMTAEEVFLTQFNQLDEQLQELLVKYQTEKVTGIDITKVKFYKPQARNSNILIEFQKRAESEAERQALVAANERIAQENANMIKAAKGQNDLVTAKELAVLQRDLKLKRTKRKSRR